MRRIKIRKIINPQFPIPAIAPYFDLPLQFLLEYERAGYSVTAEKIFSSGFV
jgi:hypothetical protein